MNALGNVSSQFASNVQRQLNHPSHNHTLTLLPLKGSHLCIACGMEDSKDFSYLCQICFFWIHKSCASAPAQLIRKDHHKYHPLVLAYSLPGEYQSFGVSCNLCPDKVYPFYWLYYCAGCRYFAHVLSAAESGKDGNEINNEDVERSNLVNFPISDDQPYLLYHLIEQFAKKFGTSTYDKSGKADEISQCHNSHSLILFDDYYDKDVDEKDTSGKRICNVCVQPLSPPDSFYRCHVCNFDLQCLCYKATKGVSTCIVSRKHAH